MAEIPKKHRNRVRLVLVLSLAMNIAVVAAVAGFVLRGGPGHRDDPNTRADGAPYARALDPEDRRAVGRSMRQAFRAAQSERGAIGDDYREAVAVLRAVPFDPAAFAAVLSRQNARAAERQRLGQAVLLDFVAEMSDERRAAYAARLDSEIVRMAERWGRDKRD